MLAGAYSSRYKTVERDQVDHLKSVKQEEKVDVIARNRRLTQATNKRRRAQALKRKHELQREEKRRQYILSKRREEQQRATENYQRAHVPNSRPNSRRSSPTRGTTGLEEALKLIRGTQPPSRPNSYSSATGHRGRQSPRGYNNNSYDPLSKPYFNKYSSRHLRPQSPSERAQEHAKMLDKSLRNYTDSRSLFEQQLEQHQQLLLEEQKMSLHNFNQAIQLEMEADTKLAGTEEMIEDSPWMTRSDSVSSVDSLEASQESIVRDRPGTAKISCDMSSKSKSSHRPVQPRATPLVGRVAPNSASVTVSDSLETSSKPFQVDYSSKTSTKNYDSGAVIGPIMNNRVTEEPFLLHGQPQIQEQDTLQEFKGQQQVQAHQMANAVNNHSYVTTDSVRSQFSTFMAPQQACPVPISSTGVQRSDIMAAGQPVTQTTSLPPSVNGHTMSQTPSLPPSVSSNSLLPSSLNSKLDSIKQTTVSTLSFTSVSSPSYTTVAAVSQQSLPQTTVSSTTASSTNPTSFNMSHRTPGLSNTTSYLNSATRPAPTVTRPAPTVTAEKLKVEGKPPPASKASDKGSIQNGTLGLVHGRLAVLADIEAVARDNQPPPEQTAQRKALSMRSASDLEPREVKGILKRPETGKLRKVMSTGNLQKTGLNVKDSIEVARGHQSMRKKSGRKSVRFADLHYDDEIPEDTDSVDSNTDLATPVKKVSISQKTAGQKSECAPNGRQRPFSAKVSGSNRFASARMARATSAGPSRSGQPQHAHDRPRAAAHIIAHSVEGNDYLSGNPDKKVTVVTNNFMGKVPSTSKTGVSSQGFIYPASNAFTNQDGDIQVPSTSVLQKAESVTTAYQSKYVTAPVSSQLPQDAATQRKIQETYNENGLRIDRTPTDDEINWLWEKVRTCLNREPTPMEKTTASLAATDPNIALSRQAAPVSNKYIDGTSLGLTSNTRVAPGIYGNSVQQRAMNNMNTRQKPGSANTGSYMRKFGLLQQRKQQTDSKKTTQNYNPTVSKMEPEDSDMSHVARNDITESMANFLVAEHFAGRSMSESQVQLAMEEAHQRQMEIRADAGRRGQAGPSALSMEEKKLMESLDRLNDKLKISEGSHPPVTNNPKSAAVQHYVHVGSRPPI